MDTPTRVRDGADGIGFADVPDQLTSAQRQRQTFVNQNRFIPEDDVGLAMQWFNRFPAFTDEEQLQFAIAFKQFPKDYHKIPQQIPSKTSKDCIRHYYKNKHDGRFQVENLVERGKTIEDLPPSDRRVLEDFPDIGGTRKDRGKRKVGNGIVNKIPIEVEIERLLQLLPGARQKYNNELKVAKSARTARVAEARAEAKAEKEAAKEAARHAKAKKAEEARAKKSKAEGKGKSKVGSEADQNTFDALDHSFGRIHQSLENVRRFVVELLAKLETAGYDGDNTSHDAYKSRLALLEGMLSALLDESEEMDRSFDQPIVTGGHPEEFITLCRFLIAAKIAIVELETDRETLRAKLATMPMTSTRKGGKQEMMRALQDRAESRDVQLTQLNSLVEGLLGMIKDENEDENEDDDDDADEEETEDEDKHDDEYVEE